MSKKLKIYACSGIGNTNTEYNYWLDDTKTVSNTQAVNGLLSMINLCYSEVQNLNMTTSERVERLNQIDIYSVSMYYAQVYANAPEDLHRAGQVIGYMLEKGVFDYDSLSNEERDTHLDEVLEQVADVISDDTLKASGEFTKWWKTNVEDKDKVFLSKKQQESVTTVLENAGKKISGVGATYDDWKQNADLAEYLNNAAEYFLYTYFTDEQLKNLPRVFSTKKKTQQKTYNYCKAMFVGVYGSEESMQNIIRAGIISYFKETPEQVCTSIANNETKGVGIATEIAVALIGAAVTLIVGIITAICNCVSQTKVAKYQTIDTAAATAATPDAGDFDGMDVGNSNASNSKLWIMAAAAAGLYLIFNK